MGNPHIGSDFDDFLKEEGIRHEFDDHFAHFVPIVTTRAFYSFFIHLKSSGFC
jgi:hypothetical protein